MKDIKGYEGLYAITEDGQVWSYKRKIFLKPNKNQGGYLQVQLYKNGSRKSPLVHRLVLETYCPIDEMEKLQCNHLNQIRDDNRLSNLSWCTAKENCNYGEHNTKLAAAMKNNSNRNKRVLCVETGEIYPSIKEAERQTGISQGNISKCCNGKRKTAGGFHWEFVD